MNSKVQMPKNKSAKNLLRTLKEARERAACFHELSTTDCLPDGFWKAVDIALGEYVKTWRDDPATPAQRRVLEKSKAWRDGMTKGEASDWIDSSIANAKDRRKYGGYQLMYDEDDEQPRDWGDL